MRDSYPGYIITKDAVTSVWGCSLKLAHFWHQPDGPSAREAYAQELITLRKFTEYLE